MWEGGGHLKPGSEPQEYLGGGEGSQDQSPDPRMCLGSKRGKSLEPQQLAESGRTRGRGWRRGWGSHLVHSQDSGSTGSLGAPGSSGRVENKSLA